MENIARASGIGRWNFERGGFDQSPAIEEHGPVGSARDSHDGTTVPVGKFTRVFHEVQTRDEVIHKLQKLVRRLVVDFIDIDDNRYLCFAGPSRGLKCSSSVAAIEVKDAAARNQILAQLTGGILQARI